MKQIVLEQNSEETGEEAKCEEKDLDSDSEDSDYAWFMDTRGVPSQAISNNDTTNIDTTNSELDKTEMVDVVQENDEVLSEEGRFQEQLADDGRTEGNDETDHRETEIKTEEEQEKEVPDTNEGREPVYEDQDILLEDSEDVNDNKETPRLLPRRSDRKSRPPDRYGCYTAQKQPTPIPLPRKSLHSHNPTPIQRHSIHTPNQYQLPDTENKTKANDIY